jgi:hypothetical protein
VDFAVPAVPEGFYKYEISGKTIYVQKRIKAVNSGLKFKIKKVFFMKQIVVDGIQKTGL